MTPWTVDCCVPLSIVLPRQEYWNRLPFPPLGDLPDPGIEPTSLVPPELAGGFFTTVPPGKPIISKLGAINLDNPTSWNHCEGQQEIVSVKVWVKHQVPYKHKGPWDGRLVGRAPWVRSPALTLAGRMLLNKLNTLCLSFFIHKMESMTVLIRLVHSSLPN